MDITNQWQYIEAKMFVDRATLEYPAISSNLEDLLNKFRGKSGDIDDNLYTLYGDMQSIITIHLENHQANN